ncbi:unnamed protein product [marine sediment metagenome]|uniref:Uncharacterized protein n=1 Tax=marine sediment metagenome TaxID=412755 RepID=X0ZQP9_9ZZZZ
MVRLRHLETRVTRYGSCVDGGFVSIQGTLVVLVWAYHNMMYVRPGTVLAS